ncbi:MAG: dTDP-4-dehydrorhamnose 3,5-epimerase [Pseudomonadota bacterium]
MRVEDTALDGVKLLRPKRITDIRGYFQESWNDRVMADLGLPLTFVQENQSFSAKSGTLRGLHYQAPPAAQGKLVRVTTGEILDVAVDVRAGSPTYGQYVSAVLNASSGWMMWVPEGFLHGFVTRAHATTVQYRTTDFYAPDCDGAVAFDDPDLAIDWGIDLDAAITSPKDADAPRLRDWVSPFSVSPASRAQEVPA